MTIKITNGLNGVIDIQCDGSGSDLNITQNNGELTINGVAVPTRTGLNVKVNVYGNVDSLRTTSGDVEVTGYVNSLNTTSGDVEVGGSVNNSVATTSGDVYVKEIAGNVYTVSGNIVARR